MANRDHLYDKEDPHRTRLATDPYKAFKKPASERCAETTYLNNSSAALAIPMAVTDPKRGRTIIWAVDGSTRAGARS
jgi:hypothetical protein